MKIHIVFAAAFISLTSLVTNSHAKPTNPNIPTKAHTWGIQYREDFVDMKRDYVILDLWGYDPRVLPKTSKYIAYFSIHFETWRDDAAQFNPLWLGAKFEEWEGEASVLEANIDDVMPIMKKRLDLAKAKGFVGVDFDNLDRHPKASAIYYWKKLAAYARSIGLIVGQKNYPEIMDKLDADFHSVESCVRFEECYKYMKTKKAVVDVEYRQQDFVQVKGLYVIFKDRFKMDHWDVNNPGINPPVQPIIIPSVQVQQEQQDPQ